METIIKILLIICLFIIGFLLGYKTRRKNKSIIKGDNNIVMQSGKTIDKVWEGVESEYRKAKHINK